MADYPSVTFTFRGACFQQHEKISRVVGFVTLSDIISLLDQIDDLKHANPREPKRSAITEDICDSLRGAADSFPFRTKGILLGASDYERHERDLWSFTFRARGDVLSREGVLDGGHNLLAIGIRILEIVGKSLPDLQKKTRRVRGWDNFQEAWKEAHPYVSTWRGGEEMGHIVPVEVLVPTRNETEADRESFRDELFSICEARNNNAELRGETKANQHGYFDGIKDALRGKPYDDVEWRENEGGRIRARDIIALAWIPLNRLLQKRALTAKGSIPLPSPLHPAAVYGGKALCVKTFGRLSEALLGDTPEMYGDDNGSTRISDEMVGGAFSILADLPHLHDLLYLELPHAYNQPGPGESEDANRGRFGKIRYVQKKGVQTFFTKQESEYDYPYGYIIPLLYGLQSLMKVDEKSGKISWLIPDKAERETFIRTSLLPVAASYRGVMKEMEYDPQKIGKSQLAYSTALREFEFAFIKRYPG